MDIIQVGNLVYSIDDSIIEILLLDRNTNENIIFATDNYTGHGVKDQITIELVKERTFRARIDKSKEEQRIRSKENAEVFTPSWVCNKQNNLVDNAWFNKKSVFNREVDKTWVTTKKKIDFSKSNKTWEDYVNDIRLEITCGEAPYLTSRYDTVSGKVIPLKDRIGLLDRKLRVVSENTDTKEDWINWAIKAYKAIYGYEFQGDNLLIARENLLFTFIDYFRFKFNEEPSNDLLKKIAEIISYNIFQMDGLKFVVPFSCHEEKGDSYGLVNIFDEVEEHHEKHECEGCVQNNIFKHNGMYCKIMDWETNRRVKFIELLKG